MMRESIPTLELITLSQVFIMDSVPAHLFIRLYLLWLVSKAVSYLDVVYMIVLLLTVLIIRFWLASK